ncbi:hypothetical protein GCM10010413_00280 [Promicromonospora sukumoe]|uniref:Uncharacterized protein n=1 Tax=Promicromonospora sukumoe TaxID=88382 RepID=A0A7W3JED3_9MICO|nr:hypothetical protein [Promicromonospora sukumoe]MBA8811283.1 hypothetical protein [Promicromonospora sukumoe]
MTDSAARLPSGPGAASYFGAAAVIARQAVGVTKILGVEQVVSAPERAEQSLGRIAVEPRPDGGRPRRGRFIAVLVVVLLGVIGVAVTWPQPDPPIAAEKISPPEPVDPNAAASPCTPEDLDVGLAADRTAVTPGVPVRFTVSVRNTGQVQCLVDAPRHGLAVTVYQGEVGEPTAERAWSSADCADQDEERLLLLGPGDVDTTNVSWSDARSEPGCADDQPRPKPGEYTAQVALAGVDGATSDVVRLTYTVPQPSASPSSSGDPSGEPSGNASGDPSADPSESQDGGAGKDAGKDADSKATSEPDSKG